MARLPLEIETIPTSKEADLFIKNGRKKYEEITLRSGEEYCLLFTMSESGFDEILEKFEKKFSKAFYKIGKIEKGSGILLRRNGELVTINESGYDHFLRT